MRYGPSSKILTILSLSFQICKMEQFITKIQSCKKLIVCDMLMTVPTLHQAPIMALELYLWPGNQPQSKVDLLWAAHKLRG